MTKKDRRRIARYKRRERRQATTALKHASIGKYQAPKKKSPARAINESLKYAAQNRSYLEKYGMLIEPLTKELVGYEDYIPKKDDTNDYFEVDSEYNGDIRTLFKHIRFKNIPETEETKAYVEAILNQPWSNEESLREYETEWHHKSYMGNIKDEILQIVSPLTLEILETIMNSSSAWEMAGAGDYESNQVKENWISMYKAVNTAKESNDFELYSEVTRRIENGDGDYSDIVAYVNDEILKRFRRQ